MNLTIYLESLGCSKNLIDGEVMLGILNQYGYKFTGDREKADAIIVNTCGFIESAKEESINKIIEIGTLKEKNLKVLIVSGCLGERYHQELMDEMPEIDAVIGTGNYDEIIDAINQAIKGDKVLKVGNVNKKFDESLPRFQTTPTYTAYIKISDGCDNYCTYCIIPKLRGKYRSRKIEHIVKEAEQLAEKGTKEIVLIAQDTARYGIDIYKKFMLPRLLTELNKIEKIKWIRLLYCYPEAITEELIDTIAKNEKICKYIDMPVQHCSNEILKKMNRKTNKKNLVNLIENLREKIPGIIIRTTLIVGFPGESREHFEELKEFVQTMKFEKLGVFCYSREEGTPADKLPNHVDDNIKEKRLKSIMEIQQKISMEKNKNKTGTIAEVLVEEKIGDCNEYIGRTQGDAPEIDGLIYIRSHKSVSAGDIIAVKVTAALEYDLIGEAQE